MIGPFEGEFEFLSNFYEGKPIYYKGNYYKTAEHAFQAAKANTELDRAYISLADTPGQAKRRGRTTSLRSDWEIIKLNVMYEIVKAKFSQSEVLKNKLLKTGNDDLVEVNYWNDFFWGVSREMKGQNHLGKILMRVRKELQSE